MINRYEPDLGGVQGNHCEQIYLSAMLYDGLSFSTNIGKPLAVFGGERPYLDHLHICFEDLFSCSLLRVNTQYMMRTSSEGMGNWCFIAWVIDFWATLQPRRANPEAGLCSASACDVANMSRAFPLSFSKATSYQPTTVMRFRACSVSEARFLRFTVDIFDWFVYDFSSQRVPRNC